MSIKDRIRFRDPLEHSQMTKSPQPLDGKYYDQCIWHVDEHKGCYGLQQELSRNILWG